MKYFRVETTTLINDDAVDCKLAYEHNGEAFAVIKNGYLYVYELDTRKHIKLLRLSDFYDVNIYNY